MDSEGYKICLGREKKRKKELKISLLFAKFLFLSENFNFRVFLSFHTYISFYSLYIIIYTTTYNTEKILMIFFLFLSISDLILNFFKSSKFFKIYSKENINRRSGIESPGDNWSQSPSLTIINLSRSSAALQSYTKFIVSENCTYSRIFPVSILAKNFIYIFVVLSFNIGYATLFGIGFLILIEIFYSIWFFILFFKGKIINYLVFLGQLLQSLCFVVVLLNLTICFFLSTRPLLLQEMLIYICTFFMVVQNILLIIQIIYSIYFYFKNWKKNSQKKPKRNLIIYTKYSNVARSKILEFSEGDTGSLNNLRMRINQRHNIRNNIRKVNEILYRNLILGGKKLY